MKYFFIIVITMLSSATLKAKEGHFTEFVGASGQIDWTSASVSAIGYGVAPEGKNPKVAPLLACRAAIVDAQRNLLESFQGVRVTATTLVSNYMLTSDTVKSSVEGTIRGAVIKLRENRADGSCKVKLQAPLRGKTANAIYKNLTDNNLATFNLMPFLSTFVGVAHAATLTNAPFNSEQALTQKLAKLSKRVTDIEAILQKNSPKKPQITKITGIVIDVRGSNFIPSLDPKIRQASGAILYPTKQNRADVINNGQLVSLFSNDLNFAMEHPLIGENPLLIKARQTWQNNLTELLLAQQDADKITYLVTHDLLKNIGVIIVLE